MSDRIPPLEAAMKMRALPLHERNALIAAAPNVIDARHRWEGSGWQVKGHGPLHEWNADTGTWLDEGSEIRTPSCAPLIGSMIEVQAFATHGAGHWLPAKVLATGLGYIDVEMGENRLRIDSRTGWRHPF